MDGSIPDKPMSELTTAKITEATAMGELGFILREHVRTDERHQEQIESKIETLHKRVSGVQKFQYATTGGIAVIVVLLGFLAWFARTTMMGVFQEAIKGAGLDGLPTRVEILERDIEKKSSIESAGLQDRRLDALEGKAHVHAHR